MKTHEEIEREAHQVMMEDVDAAEHHDCPMCKCAEEARAQYAETIAKGTAPKDDDDAHEIAHHPDCRVVCVECTERTCTSDHTSKCPCGNPTEDDGTPDLTGSATCDGCGKTIPADNGQWEETDIGTIRCGDCKDSNTGTEAIERRCGYGEGSCLGLQRRSPSHSCPEHTVTPAPSYVVPERKGELMELARLATKASRARHFGFACMECGRKFHTVTAAKKASYNGCPNCGGLDIEMA